MDEQTPAINEQNQFEINFAELTREQLVDQLKTIVETQDIATIKDQVDTIKLFFYKKQQSELNTLDDITDDDAQTPSPETPATADDTQDTTDNQTEETAEEAASPRRKTDPVEADFKAALTLYRQKREEYKAKVEAEQQANYEKKKQILADIERLVESTDDLSETLPTFRQLQEAWKEIGQVPQTVVNDLWKEYNHRQEQFYDLIKINAALREYDFKKNLDAKQNLIAQAQELEKEEDVVKAFKALQGLHDQWREIGPVERDLREQVWDQFKQATTVINKKHQSFFEAQKEEEQRITAQLEQICTDIETIDYSTLTTYKAWEDASATIIATNASFRPNTPIERRVINRLYKRYRSACNKFFESKNQFFHKMKEELQENYDKKRRLVEKAEQLKNSTQWTATTNQYIAMQKEWKTIGPVSKKVSDAIWQRFTAACDHFFEQKEQNLKGQKIEEQQNLQQKYEAIEAIKNYVMTGNDDEDYSALRRLADAYQVIGHVPYKEKDKVYAAYREASNEKFGHLRTKRRIEQLSFDGDINKLNRQYEILKQQIATYENNIGFFAHNNTKKQNMLVRDLEQKIANLKQDLKIITEQIQKINEK